MKIYYKTVIYGYGDNKGEVKSTHIIDAPEPCCDGMDGEYDDHITFGDEYNSNSPQLSFKGVSWGECDYIKIDFCPFCGVPFEFIEKEKYEERKKCKTVETTQCEYKQVKIEGE